jgi:bacterioferritin (cytochrome b1)
MAEVEMDVQKTLKGLNRALALQLRSVVQLTLAGGSATGIAFVGLADLYSQWARHEVEDAGRLAEKIVSVGGEPETKPAAAGWDADPVKMAKRLVKCEEETIEAIRKTIAPAGDFGPGEALEHTFEHMIMRKQSQVDRLQRALYGT